MKEILKKGISCLVIALFLFACAGGPETKKEKSLSLDAKAKNTFKNTTMIFSGSMMLAFSQVFKTQAQDFEGLFEDELTDDDIKVLDEKINSLDEETRSQLEEMMSQIDQAFDEMADKDMSIYKKMFLADIVKDGVAITEKYDLPYGFRPLSQNLSHDEIERYIIKVTTDSQDSEDPIVKTYMELFEWFQQVNEEYKADPEIQEYLNSLREKR